MAVLKINEVQRLMLQKAEGSSLSEREVKLLQFKAFTADDSRKHLKLQKHAACFKIPYFDLDGKPNGFYRVRYMEDVRDSWAKVVDSKQQRYAQPPGSSLDVYFPPLLSTPWRDIAGNAEIPLVITEGELKAACATKAGLPCIGLGGVWSFKSARETKLLLEPLQEIDWGGRAVYICYDSDAATNPKVMQAENALARELTKEGAIVTICRLPQDEEMDAKVGLDDWLYKHDNDGEAFRRDVLDTGIVYAQCEMLHRLNTEVLLIENPPMIYVHKNRSRVTPEQFKNTLYANWSYPVSKMIGKSEIVVDTPAAPDWIKWKHRAVAKGITYAPGKDLITEGGELNTWTGWGTAQPREGDLEPWHHLMQHLFGKDDAARIWFERWCAYPIQHPGRKLKTAALLWGVTHGSGKTMVGHTLMRLYGDRHSAELKDTDLDDESNTWAADKSFILADDISSKLDRKTVRRFMTMITQRFVRINPKYVPQYSLPDLINYLFTSNEPDAIYLEDGDRRFFVHEVLAQKYLNYKEYVEWRDGDDLGIEALWYYLLNLDLGDFDPDAPAPDTQGKRDMLTLGKSDMGSFVHELKVNGQVILRKKQMAGDLFSVGELMAIYDPEGNKRVTGNALGRELKKQGFRPPGTGTNLEMPDGSRVNVYAILNGDKWAQASRKEATEHYVNAKPKGFFETKRSKM